MAYKWDKIQLKISPIRLRPLYALVANNINIDKDYGDIIKNVPLFLVKKI
jgi:hypothetical protein